MKLLQVIASIALGIPVALYMGLNWFEVGFVYFGVYTVYLLW